MNTKILSLIALAALACQARASSDEAWATLDRAVLESCTRASGLNHPQPVGKAAQFDDQLAYTALLLQGQYPQKQLRGQSGIELCLYNKRTRTAAVTEWDSIRPVIKRP